LRFWVTAGGLGCRRVENGEAFSSRRRITCESLRLITALVKRVDPSADGPMKTRIGPVGDTLHQAVL